MFFAMLAIGIAPGNAPADQAGWTVQFGTAAVDVATGVAVHGRNVYVVGQTLGTLPGQISAGGFDLFVSKYTSRGELKWTDQFGTPGDDQPTQGSMDARGKLVVVGGFVTGALPGQTWAGGNDAFLRAYDRKGNVLWTLQFGSPQSDHVRSVAIAKDGSIFVAGFTTGELTNQLSAGSTDAFAMRLDPDGTVRWLLQFGTSGADQGNGIAVTKDAVYVAGTTNGAFPGNANAGGFDGFVARLTLDGEIEWVTQFGTFAVDNALKIGVAGPTVFVSGNTGGQFPGETFLGNLDAVVAALGHDGELKWVRQFGTAGFDTASGLAVDHEGAVAAGREDPLPLATQNPGSDVFARKYDADGNLLWAIQFGTPVFDSLNDVAVKGHDVYLVGATEGDLGGPSAGGRDAFLMRIRSVEDDDDDDEDDEDNE